MLYVEDAHYSVVWENHEADRGDLIPSAHYTAVILNTVSCMNHCMQHHVIAASCNLELFVLQLIAGTKKLEIFER